MLKRILGEGFRTFFLLAPLWAILAMSIWLVWLWGQGLGGGSVLRGPVMPPHLWHGHEMVHGYGSAVMAGFLLTAVAKGRRGFIAGAAALWLAGRLAFWLSGSLNPWLVAVVDLAFLPLLGGHLVLTVLHRKSPQHLLFLVFVAAMVVGDILSHLDLLGVVANVIETGQRMGLLALCSLIAIIAGRVVPGFVRNAMKRAGLPEARWPAPVPMLGRVIIVAGVVLPWLAMWRTGAGAVAAVLAVAVAIRLWRWHPLFTRGDPLLWSLMVAQAALAAGLALWALAQFGIGSEIGALHVLGIGAVGGMTLAVMSRAVLAHTGRALKAPGPVVFAYGGVVVAVLARWGASALAEAWYYPLVLLSGGLWIVAFGLFVAGLIGPLTAPRRNKPPVGPPPPIPGE